MEQRIDLFLSTSGQTMLGEPGGATGEEIVSDAEVDKLIGGEAAEAERAADQEIDRGLKEIRDELDKGR